MNALTEDFILFISFIDPEVDLFQIIKSLLDTIFANIRLK